VCPPGNQDRFISQWCIPCLCRSLSLDNLVTVFNVLLLEKQTVFISKYLGVESHVVMALLPLLRPYSWQGTLLPVLPNSLLECLQAPVPFLFGVQNSGQELVLGPDCVVVNLDENKISLPAKTELSQIPKRKKLVVNLTQSYNEIRGTDNSLVSYFRASERQQQAVQEFSQVFRQWHTDLIKEVTSSIPENVKTMDFSEHTNVTAFLKGITKTHKEFMAQFILTQQFSMLTDQLLLERTKKEDGDLSWLDILLS